MFKHNFLTYGSQIILKIISDIVIFPIWWYSVGFLEMIKKGWRFLCQREKALGFSIWLKNILVPMYGQYDWAGRIISFFVRLIQVIFRGLFLIFWLIVFIVSILLWLAGPIFLFLSLFFQLVSFYGV
ncbi:MAG: hypothetical protein PHH52_00515 [Patescibacteria group bacterium]|jgi:hypothetical protein|nr:hypothetical protein [Patescibacteria group bacterium]MDD3777852.1 hypothetical protein [Patescibacteria group bacterium]MDD3939352.1 hypothetical protein [Patescibacteria group bacterium]MDD4443991.1 hypothetical protein [Patescibacteria group bacterium]NCU39444.1 hypothetical protein [Candidatus Falkowbacteria bacterium]